MYLKPIKEIDERSKDGSKQWLYRCVCGKEIISTPYRVNSGHIKSCGCMKYQKGKKHKSHKRPQSKIDANQFIGKKSNALTVIDVFRPLSGRTMLVCKCECGNTKNIYPFQFTSQSIKSCGCILNKDKITHGLSDHPLYSEWFSMVNRCHNPSAHNYSRYGRRGIEVCEEWRYSPENFISWVESTGGRPIDSTLDRIDNDKGYSPENCRWASVSQQSRNKRSNRMITYKGISKCLSDWCNELNINTKTAISRFSRGWTVEEVFETPVDKSSRNKRAK